MSEKRLAFTAGLVFLEAFLTPINGILAQGIWPTPVQLAWCLTTGILQVTTVLAGVLEKF
jgi:hypothetical protein